MKSTDVSVSCVYLHVLLLLGSLLSEYIDPRIVLWMNHRVKQDDVLAKTTVIHSFSIVYYYTFLSVATFKSVCFNLMSFWKDHLFFTPTNQGT